MTTTPTAAEVEALRQRCLDGVATGAARLRHYNTAKAAHEAANDTGRILDEAIAARQVALDAYSVTWSTRHRANVAAAEAIDARYAASAATSAASIVCNDAFAAFAAARKAHEATR
jgi:hypothetical protein